jgi:acid phosphatase
MKSLIGLVFVAPLLLACSMVSDEKDAAAPNLSQQNVLSALWLQTSAEYRALSLQVYSAAYAELPMALADKDRTATVPTAADTASLPPAIIMDVDETVLSNARFQGDLIRHGTTFDRGLFSQWVNRSNAPALPGALEFVKAADQLGIKIFFVTNRDASLEAATRENLQRAGFPLERDFDNLLMRNERPEWTRDKESRRSFIATNYRVIMIFGDDLNDFTSAATISPGHRQNFVAESAEFWGRHWFLLPNPAYGSWEQALYGFRRNLDAGEKLRLRMHHLQHSDSSPH